MDGYTGYTQLLKRAAMGQTISPLYMFGAAGATWGIAKSRFIGYVGVTFRNFATLPFDEGRFAALPDCSDRAYLASLPEVA